MKNRHIFYIINTPNNLMFNLTDWTGKTKFFFTAKSAKYKSKQVRSTIVIDVLWKTVLNKLKTVGIINLSLKFKGTFFKKQHLIKDLRKQGFKILSIDIFTPIAYNGCKQRHLRRK